MAVSPEENAFDPWNRALRGGEETEVDMHLSQEPVPEGGQASAYGARRPKSLSTFVGQPHAASQLSIFIEAARARGRPMDHVLLSGPPGLGKTTLARIIANELGYSFSPANAGALSKPGDIAALLVNLAPWTVLFIDEIHRLPRPLEEMLYSAMEDRVLDLLVGEGVQARSLRIELPPFTLVGATTRSGSLSQPLRDRFGIPIELTLYSPEDLEGIVRTGAEALGQQIEDVAVRCIAGRARGTPRIALRLLQRVADFALAGPAFVEAAAGNAVGGDAVGGDAVGGDAGGGERGEMAAPAGRITVRIADIALQELGIDASGLTKTDRRYLEKLVVRHRGGPTGLKTLSASLGIGDEQIEHDIEPYLLSLGLIDRASNGRLATASGRRLVSQMQPARSNEVRRAGLEVAGLGRPD